MMLQFIFCIRARLDLTSSRNRERSMNASDPCPNIPLRNIPTDCKVVSIFLLEAARMQIKM